MTLTLSNREKKLGPAFLLLQMLLVPYGAATLCAMLSIHANTIANLMAFYANAVLAWVFFRELLPFWRYCDIIFP